MGKPRTYRNPPRGSSTAERRELHRAAMVERRHRYERNRSSAYYIAALTPNSLGRAQAKLYANPSRFHPDFGQSPAEHAVSKAKRVEGLLAFQPKEARRARLGRLI